MDIEMKHLKVVKKYHDRVRAYYQPGLGLRHVSRPGPLQFHDLVHAQVYRISFMLVLRNLALPRKYLERFN